MDKHIKEGAVNGHLSKKGVVIKIFPCKRYINNKQYNSASLEM